MPLVTEGQRWKSYQPKVRRPKLELGQATDWGHTKAASRTQGGATACTATAGGSLTVHPDQRPPPALQEDRQKEGLVELPTSSRELLTFFCTNATIHGAIRLVCSSQSRVRTASWGLLVAGALGVLYWLLFAEYWPYPVVATVSVHSEPKLFPAVTLCDMNPHR